MVMLSFSLVTCLTYALAAASVSAAFITLAVLQDILFAPRRPQGGVNRRSGIYYGRVWHVRFKPTVHRFTYPVFYCLVDLDELASGVGIPW